MIFETEVQISKLSTENADSGFRAFYSLSRLSYSFLNISKVVKFDHFNKDVQFLNYVVNDPLSIY